ncbi:MAG TPA: OmpA family protein, partial [Minicystis sp.]|nr:OmpA family protein [Minicystis sp.]
DGCPDPDNDKDGIPDEQDECINQPETYNGYQDADGCPDTPPGGPSKLVEMTDKEIKILEKIEFDTGKATIKGARSFQILDAVASVLKNAKQIALVEVAGHTDNVGPAVANRKLSQKRAEAVVAYLVKKGIDKKRLEPKGYGPDQPIADNKTAEGKQKNRRVEFRILKVEKPAPAPAAAPPPKK